MARFKTAVSFFTLDNLHRLGEEYEDEIDTLCMVTELKEAAATDGSNHSSLHSSLSCTVLGLYSNSVHGLLDALSI